MLNQLTIPPIKFLGEELPVVDSVKDVGVILDKSLPFMGKLGMTSRIRHLFDHLTLFTVINSL